MADYTPWTPHARGARPLRLVVAIDELDLPDDEMDRLPAAFPNLELTYPNGSTRRARAP